MSIKKHHRKKQVLSLYTAMVLGVIVGIGVSVINTRLLGPEQYGDLKFIQSLFAFAVTFLTLGFFVTGGRMLAQDKNSAISREITGSVLVIASIVSVIFSLLIFVFSFYEDAIFDNDLSNIIRLFSPFLFVFPYQLCMETILQGTNRIYELSAFRILPQLLYIMVAVLFNYIFPLSLTHALSIQFIVLGGVITVMLIRLRPRFININTVVRDIVSNNMDYGLQVYFGSIFGVASAQLGGIAIAYYIDNINVGYYSLALSITLPLALIPNVIGTTFFKEFTNTSSISIKIIISTAILSVLSLIAYYLIIKQLVVLLYSEKYLRVVQLTYPMALGSILHGFGDLINRFLGAHGRGAELRNGAIIVGIINIAGFIVLVYFFGVGGAAATKLAAGAGYCLSMYWYYSRYRKIILQ